MSETSAFGSGQPQAAGTQSIQTRTATVEGLQLHHTTLNAEIAENSLGILLRGSAVSALNVVFMPRREPRSSRLHGHFNAQDTGTRQSPTLTDNAAWAAARRATGTRYGDALT